MRLSILIIVIWGWSGMVLGDQTSNVISYLSGQWRVTEGGYSPPYDIELEFDQEGNIHGYHLGSRPLGDCSEGYRNDPDLRKYCVKNRERLNMRGWQMTKDRIILEISLGSSIGGDNVQRFELEPIDRQKMVGRVHFYDPYMPDIGGFGGKSVQMIKLNR